MFSGGRNCEEERGLGEKTEGTGEEESGIQYIYVLDAKCARIQCRASVKLRPKEDFKEKCVGIQYTYGLDAESI